MKHKNVNVKGKKMTSAQISDMHKTIKRINDEQSTGAIYIHEHPKNGIPAHTHNMYYSSGIKPMHAITSFVKTLSLKEDEMKDLILTLAIMYGGKDINIGLADKKKFKGGKGIKGVKIIK